MLTNKGPGDLRRFQNAIVFMTLTTFPKKCEIVRACFQISMGAKINLGRHLHGNYMILVGLFYIVLFSVNCTYSALFLLRFLLLKWHKLCLLFADVSHQGDC